MTLIDNLIRRYRLVSDQITADDLRLILTELQAVLDRDIPGDIGEFGCYVGTTSLFIRRLLDQLQLSRQRNFHVYDSFAGLPAKAQLDESRVGDSFKTGSLAVSKKQFAREFKRAGLALPTIHKAWFEDLADTDLPSVIAFAFLDGDFYNSILSALKLVWPRLSQDGVVLIHDYSREALPGVERAVREFFSMKTPSLIVKRGMAVMKKPCAVNRGTNTYLELQVDIS